MAETPPSGDDRLVARLAAGEEDAWRECLALHGRLIEGSCRRALLRAGRPSDPGAVEEAAAEVHRMLLEDGARLLKRFRPGTSLPAYLRVIAWTKTLSKAARTRVQAPLDESRLQAPQAQDDDPMGRVERLRKALASLPERDAQVLRWFYMDALPYAEIARRSGIGLAGVGMMLSRARERLKAAMQKDES